MDYAEILEETPSFTLFKMFVRQFLCVLFFSGIGLLLTSPGVSQWLPTLLVVSAVRIKNGFRALNTLSIKAQPKR